jgi:hypothetical protein
MPRPTPERCFRYFSEYEEYRRKTLGEEATHPHRITYRKLTRWQRNVSPEATGVILAAVKESVPKRAPSVIRLTPSRERSPARELKTEGRS